MSVAHEIARAQKWIRDKVAGDDSIIGVVVDRIYADRAPVGADVPFVLFSFQSGFDTRGNGTVRIQSNPTFQIKVVSEGPITDDVLLVADRLDTLFQEAVTEISESYVFSSRRLQPLSYVEPRPGSTSYYTHTGGLYRLVIYPEA